MYNARMGFSRKDDSLPGRFLSEAMKNGESAGQTVDLDRLLDEYYQAMGWGQNGIPSQKTLGKLDLIDIVSNDM
jgi:aldehyde:ferredoxin oxidoreductase